jgi:signal transduction histidine kinase
MVAALKKRLLKLLPRTLFGQILLALVIGLTVAQSAGFWLMLDDRTQLGERLLGIYASERIAGVISILDRAGPDERKRLLHALNVPPTHVSLDEPWQTAGLETSDDARAFIARLQKELERPAELHVVSIKRAEPRRRPDPFIPRPPGPDALPYYPGSSAGMGPRGMPSPPPPPPLPSQPVGPASMAAGPAGPGSFAAPAGRTGNRRARGPSIVQVVGQVRLSDGAVLTFRHSLPQQGMDWPMRLLTYLIGLGIFIALLSAWAVRRLTRPLASLADAATGLAQNLERPPLPENGTLEVLRAAQAFNAMQRDIKRYLETRAQALAAVSHDLRLPLTRLRLRLERLPEGEMKEKMDGDLTEMDQMIGNTLEFLRAGSSAEKMQKLDINALIESVSEDMMMVGAQITLQGAVSGPVAARPQALRRCLGNLFDNAMRYGGGRFDVCVEEQEDMIEIRIDDYGTGISAADLELVFEPYVRIEASRAKHTGGCGLGLTIARAIARAHGGDVQLSAHPLHSGMSALLTLPRRMPA